MGGLTFLPFVRDSKLPTTESAGPGAAKKEGGDKDGKKEEKKDVKKDEKKEEKKGEKKEENKGEKKEGGGGASTASAKTAPGMSYSKLHRFVNFVNRAC